MLEWREAEAGNGIKAIVPGLKIATLVEFQLDNET